MTHHITIPPGQPGTLTATPSAPPEAAAERDGHGLYIVPPLGGDVEHLPRLQNALQKRSGGKEGKGGGVGALHVDLAGVGVHAGGVWVEGGCVGGAVEAHVLAADDLL